jgi:predicted amidohydrolase YtcJ
VVRRDKRPGALAPEERITVEQALTLYTRNAAYAGFEEDKKVVIWHKTLIVRL